MCVNGVGGKVGLRMFICGYLFGNTILYRTWYGHPPSLLPLNNVVSWMAVNLVEWVAPDNTQIDEYVCGRINNNNSKLIQIGHTTEWNVDTHCSHTTLFRPPIAAAAAVHDLQTIHGQKFFHKISIIGTQSIGELCIHW